MLSEPSAIGVTRNANFLGLITCKLLYTIGIFGLHIWSKDSGVLKDLERIEFRREKSFKRSNQMSQIAQLVFFCDFWVAFLSCLYQVSVLDLLNTTSSTNRPSESSLLKRSMIPLRPWLRSRETRALAQLVDQMALIDLSICLLLLFTRKIELLDSAKHTDDGSPRLGWLFWHLVIITYMARQANESLKWRHQNRSTSIEPEIRLHSPHTSTWASKPSTVIFRRSGSLQGGSQQVDKVDAYSQTRDLGNYYQWPLMNSTAWGQWNLREIN